VPGTTSVNALHGVDRAQVFCWVTNDGGVDAVRHGVPERKRVRRHEQRAHRDRDDGDHHGTLEG
jgi:hypothetical protein